MDQFAIADAELIAASRAGERRAFATLIERYQNLVCAVAYSATGDIALSEDVGQETFVAAWQHLGDIQEPDRFRGWLCATARNLARMSLRRRKREVVDGGGSAQTVESAEASALENIITEEQKALVWHAFEAIPETYREPLVLFYREEQSVKQVAQGLDLSEDAAKQRLARGRQALRDELAKLVEVTLSRTRPSRAFSALVLDRIGGAGAATTTTVMAEPARAAAAAARPLRWLLRAPTLITAATLGLVTATVPLWHGNAETASPPERPATTSAMPARAASPPPASTPHLSRPPDAHPSHPSPRAHLSPRIQPLSAEARQIMKDAIAKARSARLAHPAAQAAPAAPVTALGTERVSLANKTGDDSEWNKRQLAILNELLGDCFRLARQEQPDISGKLGIGYTITGEPGVGGLVDDIHFLEDYSTIEQGTMRECATQSLYALELDPPPDGVSVGREITLRFDPP